MNKHISSAIYRVLKPIFSVMFRNSISFGAFTRIAKQAYIEVTETEVIASGQKATTSKIAIITGLTRKDVAALRKDIPTNFPQGQKNRAVRVISGWISNPEFCDEQGKARTLTILGEKGSFEALVNRHSGDMPYRAMLNELIRTKSVKLKGDDQVILVRTAYIPSDSENEKYDVMGEDVSLLLSTIQYNISVADEATDKAPRYQRKVCYDKIPSEYIEEFQTLANKENQLLLLKLNHWLAEHDMDRQPILQSDKPLKVGVGVYYFEESPESQEN